MVEGSQAIKHGYGPSVWSRAEVLLKRCKNDVKMKSQAHFIFAQSILSLLCKLMFTHFKFTYIDIQVWINNFLNFEYFSDSCLIHLHWYLFQLETNYALFLSLMLVLFHFLDWPYTGEFSLNLCIDYFLRDLSVC